MADRTKIEWTDATWNVVRGCTRVSEGCRNCYAEIMAARFSGEGQWGHGLAEMVRLPDGTTDHRWTGKVTLAEDRLDQPLRWKKPRRIFVNATSDLFHEAVPDEWIDRVFAAMAVAPQHTFQVLTKRPERAMYYFDTLLGGGRHVGSEAVRIRQSVIGAVMASDAIRGGFPNVWLGVSIEDQATADTRIPYLLATYAAVRFVSAEPLLGPVDLRAGGAGDFLGGIKLHLGEPREALDWVIVGGESGPGARPMHPDWPRRLRDQCAATDVPFFFKQWGEWAPHDLPSELQESEEIAGRFDGASHRVGKRAAGRILDGREWNGMPG